MKREEFIKVLSGEDLDAAAAAMKDVLSAKEFAWDERNGSKSINFGHGYVDENYNWTHGIEGVHLDSKGVVHVRIYWQGDSTDGNDYMPLSKAMERNNRIPGRWYDDGKTERYPITVERKELSAMFKEVARLLQDDEIRKRKDDKIRQAVSSRVFPEFYRRYGSGVFSGETRARNGYEAVRALISAEWRRLKDLPDDELWKAVGKVRNQNYKFDHELAMSGEEKLFNLTF